MVRVQRPVPLQAPDHPAKKAPLAATGVRTTLVPALKDALQVGAQLMPAGLLVTVPPEVPASVAVSVKLVVGAGNPLSDCARLIADKPIADKNAMVKIDARK
jgi:hypothetical protein